MFPGASGVGLDPPPGMTPAKTFDGFQGRAPYLDRHHRDAGSAAFAQIDASRDMFISRFGAKEAVNVDVNGAHGFLIKGAVAVGAAHVRKVGSRPQR